MHFFLYNMYIIPYTDIKTNKIFDKLEKGSEYTGYNSMGIKAKNYTRIYVINCTNTKRGVTHLAGAAATAGHKLL